MKRPEIMSPAGDFPSLSAALRAGADAVYFGVRGANMRVGAKNFSLADLPKIARMCAEAKAKSYIVLNTIYFDSESNKIRRILRSAKRAGIDAAIAWDLSVVAAAREIGMEIFLSTQASCANAESAAEYYAKFGIRRFVLARECSLGDIKKFRARLRKILGKKAAEKIKVEIFAHGAMCVSESGRCFMSQFLCGRSANRGECVQPCRRQYFLSRAPDALPELELGGHFVMSPKDLCTLPFIEKLFAADVDSLKIEGRNRNPEYVFTVTSAYVRARNFYFGNKGKIDFEKNFADLKETLVAELSAVFNRGFSDGFFMGKPVGDWTSQGNAATKKKTIVGRVIKYYPKARAAEISVDAFGFSVGDELQAESDASGFVHFRVSEIRDAQGKAIQRAEKGEIVGTACPEKLRSGDRIYKFSAAK